MSGVFPTPGNILCPCASIEFGGAQWRMAYTLRSMSAYEWATGQRGFQPELDSLRTLIWSMLMPQAIGLDIHTVGVMSEDEFARAIEAAGELIYANRPPARDMPPGNKPKPDRPTDWYGIWSTGRIDMGLGEAEFWSLAPIQFDSLSRRLEEQRDDRLYGHAMVAAQIYNSNRTSEDQPLMEPAAYMPNAAGEAVRKQLLKDQRAGLHDKVMGMADVLKAQVFKNGKRIK